ncbi:MAG TPA: universal stress protein [Solirubrobacterales bacterium]|nr:universal stress protein [Solirubrobacterales bacterium]
MAPRIFVSYDDTENDRDALALGELLARGGAELSLAYVRHAQQSDRDREALEEREAEALLEHGAQLLGNPDLPRHVIVHASTGDGLRELALRERADIVVFGSDYRTAPGAVTPGSSAQRLLNGGPTAVAIAPAGFREQLPHRVARVNVLAEGDPAATDTGRWLAASLGAEAAADENDHGDLLVLGSTEGGRPGRVTLSASAGYELETATVPVLAVPRERPVRFVARAYAEA